MSDVRVGTSGWSYPSWRPGFYRPGSIRPASSASTQSGSDGRAEHDRLPAAVGGAVPALGRAGPDGFEFAPKLPGERPGRVAEFESRFRTLGDRLGPVRSRSSRSGTMGCSSCCSARWKGLASHSTSSIRPGTGSSGHSLRAGFVTSAAAAGATVWKMQAVTRHKSLDVLSGYVRDADAFRDHAGEGFL